MRAIGLQAVLAILTSFGLGVGLGWTIWGRRPEPDLDPVPELAPVEVRTRPVRPRTVVDVTALERSLEQERQVGAAAGREVAGPAPERPSGATGHEAAEGRPVP